MTKNLLVQALTKFVVGLAVVMVLLFVPAGTFSYWQAWLFIGVLFVPMLVVGVVLMSLQPELLRKRLDAREKEGEQKRVVLMSSLLFVAMFVVAGLNRRFCWWMLPDWLAIAAAVVFLLGYAMYAEVMREKAASKQEQPELALRLPSESWLWNVWLSRTIGVQEHQQVVDTGLYGIVRHPMYSATLVLFLTMPLILASPWSFVLMLLYVPVLVKRIKNEEKVLQQQLVGYREYMNRVCYRLIPFVW